MVILANSSSASGISQFLTVIFLFILVLFITYITTKFVGSYQKVQNLNRNFEVIETFRVTNNKYLQLVRAADKYIVIAIGKDEITKIAELDEDSVINTSRNDTSQKEVFSSLIQKAGERIKKGGNNE